MSIDLALLAQSQKLLIEAPLKPVQGHRFQPTGFPDLGAATYQTGDGEDALLVESPQSVANRLEAVCWDEPSQDLPPCLQGLSYIRVVGKDKTFMTSSILESHRINSPYILESGDKTFLNRLKEALGLLETGPIDRGLMSKVLLQYDASSLLHGVFLAKKELAGGRLRIERALSGFIEAFGVREATSGGVKKDHVNPQGDTKTGFGHVPFHRREFTAKSITAYFNLDLGQLRGYRLGDAATQLLTLLALYKVRVLLDGNLRLRTACDLEVAGDILVKRPKGFALPTREQLEAALPGAIKPCAEQMAGVTEVVFTDKKKSKK